MNLKEINAEIERVQTAITKTKSDKLIRDYGKHLRKLERIKAQYDRYGR